MTTTHLSVATFDSAMRNASAVVSFIDSHAGSVMALLTAVYVVATWRLVHLAHGQLRQSVELERSRTRPVVVFDLVVEHYFVHLSIRNLGQSLASRIRISIEPELRILHGGEGFKGVMIDPPEERDEPIPLLQSGVASLAPGREIKGEIGFFGRFKRHYPDTQFNGHVSYCGSDGASYSEPFVVDLLAMERLGRIERYDIHDVAEALRGVRSEVERIKNRLYNPPRDSGSARPKQSPGAHDSPSAQID